MTIVGHYNIPDGFPEPAGDFRLRVEIAGAWAGWFTECSGLGAERETLPVAEGGVNDHVHQLPKGVKHSRVTLKRGLADEQLWNWFVEGLYDLKIKRQNVTIALFSTDFSQVKKWDLAEAYPVKWTGPGLKTDGNQVAVEMLELVHNGLRMQAWAAAAA